MNFIFMDSNKNLAEILGIAEKDYAKYKIHLAKPDRIDKKEPLLLYYKSEQDFKEFQERQSDKNFGGEGTKILSFIRYDEKKPNKFFFVGVYEVISFILIGGGYPYKYETKKCEDANEYIGKLVVSYKDDRPAYFNLENTIKTNNILVEGIFQEKKKFSLENRSSVNLELEKLKKQSKS
jgi:hypothetical protein